MAPPEGDRRGRNVVTDPRFKSIHSDPRFQRLPRRQAPREVDARFQAALESETFGRVAKVDKRGRKVAGGDGGRKKNKDKVKEETAKEGKGGESPAKEEELGEGGLARSADASGEEDAALSPGDSSPYSSAPDDSDTSEASGVSSSPSSSEDEDEEATRRALRARGLAGPEDSDDSDEEGEEGEGDVAPSSDSEVDEGGGEAVWGAGAMAANPRERIPMLPDATARLACVDLDWAHVRAVDVLATLRSFAPRGGVVEIATVYPSDYGLERMARESVSGPEGIWEDPAKAAGGDGGRSGRAGADSSEGEGGEESLSGEEGASGDEEGSPSDGSDSDEEGSSSDGSDTDEEGSPSDSSDGESGEEGGAAPPARGNARGARVKETRDGGKAIGEEGGGEADAAGAGARGRRRPRAPAALTEQTKTPGGTDVDVARLRAYERSKLRWYYAIAVCDSPATANAIYSTCDGAELFKSGCKMDLRFVPDGQDFSARQVRDSATSVPADYAPPQPFETKALGLAAPELTWEVDDPTRTRVLRKKITADELKEDDLRTYLASDSSDEEEDEEDEEKEAEEGAGDDGEERKGVDATAAPSALAPTPPQGKRLTKAEKAARLRALLTGAVPAAAGDSDGVADDGSDEDADPFAGASGSDRGSSSGSDSDAYGKKAGLRGGDKKRSDARANGAEGSAKASSSRTIAALARRSLNPFAGAKGRRERPSDRDMELQVSFGGGLEALGDRLRSKKEEAASRESETVWQAYLRRRRERREAAAKLGRKVLGSDDEAEDGDGAFDSDDERAEQKAKTRRKGKKEGTKGEGSGKPGEKGTVPTDAGATSGPTDLGFDDPFFQEEPEVDPFADPFFDEAGREGGKAESAKAEGAKGGKRHKGKRGDVEDGEAARAERARLEMLLMDDDEVARGVAPGRDGDGGAPGGGPAPGAGLSKAEAHKLARAEKARRRKALRRKERTEGSDDEAAGGFAPDLSDPRFEAAFTSHHFALDTTDPRFDDKAKRLAAEASRRRAAKRAAPGRGGDDNERALSDAARLPADGSAAADGVALRLAAAALKGKVAARKRAREARGLPGGR